MKTENIKKSDKSVNVDILRNLSDFSQRLFKEFTEAADDRFKTMVLSATRRTQIRGLGLGADWAGPPYVSAIRG